MWHGFRGPPDSHLFHSGPLHADELDRHVIESIKGFEFGSDHVIGHKLIQILEPGSFLRTVSAWNRKRGCKGASNRWGETFSNSSLAIS